MNYWRRRAYLLLESHFVNSSLQIWIRRIIVFSILISVAAAMLETLPELRAEYKGYFLLIERSALVLFGLEYLARVWCAIEDRDPRFRHPVWGRLRYMLTPMSIIDFLSIVPAILMFVPAHDLLVMRLFRLLRMLKIMRHSPALATLWSAIYSERRAWMAVLTILVTLICFVSTLMWLVEHNAQPEAFASIPHAMWWAVVTLATVGYGDVIPVTVLGRIIGGFTMFMGVGMFTLPAAILATAFSREMGRSNFMVTYGMVSHVPLFSSLEPSLISDIAARLQPRIFHARYALLRRGEDIHALFFVATGEVEVDVPGCKPKVLGPGEMFGEVELQEEGVQVRMQATTLTECRLLELPVRDFIDLFHSHPDLREAVMEVNKSNYNTIVFEGAEAAYQTHFGRKE
jgi:voltage-gated potassium channel